MRLKRGVTTIKKLLFYSASLSIIAMGAVWMLLFQEPMADTMTKAPPPKKRALAYEQALATQSQNEADAPKAATKPKNDGAAKAQLFTIFEALKPNDPVALNGRRKLSSMIFA